MFTKGKWESYNHYVWTESHQNIANCKNVQDGNPITAAESYANAQRIVQCVNNFDGLVDALGQIRAVAAAAPNTQRNRIQLYGCFSEIVARVNEALKAAKEVE